MLPMKIRRDPAPSRIKYRLQRLWLTPSFRRFVRVGLPCLALLALGARVALDARVQQFAVDITSSVREKIADRPELMLTHLDLAGVSAELAVAIRDVADVPLPISALDINVAEVRARIETLDSVAAARVRIGTDGGLEIFATERVPAVVWRTRNGLQILDESGARTALAESRAERSDLPLIAGAGANAHVGEALAILKIGAPVADRIRGLVRIGARRWDVVLSSGQVIKLPEDDPISALRRVMALHRADEILDREVLVVDMRDAGRPILRMTAFATQELQRLRAIIDGEKT